MQITDKHVVSIAYTLKDEGGNIIDKSEDGSFCYLHGASNIISGLENALTGKQAGDAMSVSIAPEDAYGERDDEKLQQVAREMFPPEQDIEAGLQFHSEGPEGQAIVVTVDAVDGDQVTIDCNHPLPGVEYVDVVAILQQAILDRVPLYPSSIDGHPVVAGYQVIGNAIADHISGFIDKKTDGLVALEAQGGYTIYLLRDNRLQFFESYDLVLKNGWTEEDIALVKPRDIAGYSFLGNISGVEPEKYGPLPPVLSEGVASN